MFKQMEQKHKQEIDQLIVKFHDALKDGMKNDPQTQALAKSLISKQQENNERLINDQEKLIESLKQKYKQLEAEFNKSTKSSNGKDKIFL